MAALSDNQAFLLKPTALILKWMKLMKKLILAALSSSVLLTACAKQSTPATSTPTIQKESTMNTQQISNPTAKAAFEAWQKGDSAAWLALFSSDAKLLDDGSPRNFQKFSTQTIGKEKFTSIDRVENNGTAIYGDFHSPQWGDFKTYFKFTIGADGKINRLEIGQAN
jgi:hypothetical protein